MSIPKHRWLLGLCVILLLCVFALLFLGGSNRSAIEQYKAELRAKGEKVSYEELVPSPRVNVEQEKEFLSAVAQLSSALIQPGNWNFFEYAAPGAVVLSWKHEILPDQFSRDRSTNTWEDFTRESSKFEEPVSSLREILKNPAPDFSGDYSNPLNLPKRPFVQRRQAAQWFAGATLLALHKGDVDSALQNLEAILGDAELYGNEPFLVDQMIRVAIAGLALNVTWHALQAEGWTDAQMVRLHQAWQRINFPQMLENGFVGERVFQFKIHDWLKEGNQSQVFKNPGAPRNILQDYFLAPLWSATFADGDFLFATQFTGTQIEMLRRAKNHEPWVELRKENDDQYVVFSRKVNQRGLIELKYFMSARMMPNFAKARQSAMCNETFRQLTLVAIALKRFQILHGELPDKLEALVPQFLEKTPRDCMDAKPLKYRLNGDGTFTLYSVGENGTDEGGDPGIAPEKGGKKVQPDMFNGLDIVWPQPARASTSAEKRL